MTEKAKKCNTWSETLKKHPFGRQVRERRFQMCSLKEKGIGLHGAAPRGILLGYWRVNTSGSEEFKTSRYSAYSSNL